MRTVLFCERCERNMGTPIGEKVERFWDELLSGSMMFKSGNSKREVHMFLTLFEYQVAWWFHVCSFQLSTLVWEWLSHHPSRVFGGLSWFNLKSNSKTKMVPQKNSEKLWKTMICTKKTHFFVAPIPTNFVCKRQRGSDQPAVASSRSSRSYGEPRCRCVHRAIGGFSGDLN